MNASNIQKCMISSIGCINGFFVFARIPGVGDIAASADVGHQKLLFSGK